MPQPKVDRGKADFRRAVALEKESLLVEGRQSPVVRAGVHRRPCQLLGSKRKSNDESKVTAPYPGMSQRSAGLRALACFRTMSSIWHASP